MLARTGLDAQEALVCTMVLVAVADGGITDREIGVMSGIVQTMPVFRNFSSEKLEIATDTTVTLLREEEGLRHAARLIRDALEPRLRETAYALACEVAAAGRLAKQPSLECWSSSRRSSSSTRWPPPPSSAPPAPATRKCNPPQSSSRRPGATREA